MSKHVRDCSGEYRSLSDDIYIVTRGEFFGKRVRILLDNENLYGDSFSKTVEVCFLNDRHMKTYTISQADLEMI